MGCPWPHHPVPHWCQWCGNGKAGGNWRAGGVWDRHLLPVELFLTQPVQLVHVMVSGKRNLGNVVIWRRMNMPSPREWHWPGPE